MADRLPTRPPRTNWGNLSKNLALWLLVGLLALALFQMMSRQRNPTQEFSYTEFSRRKTCLSDVILCAQQSFHRNRHDVYTRPSQFAVRRA